ncbi:MAG: ribosome biogenesis GTPase YlqF [Eubacteriales bacterium]|nr:ribosome biogenesis GTPase YlqF [Eubacteriales bacterium]
MDINWYPGHMAKTIREMKSYIQQVDIVVEICDARLPQASRNPELARLVGGRPLLLVLNKADLADPSVTDRWIQWFRQNKIIAMAMDSTAKGQVKRLQKQMLDMNREQTERARARGRLIRPTRLLVAGIPNTGKSTLINSLCGKKMAKTADQPGVTRKITWIRAGQQLEMLDSPGILWPDLGSRRHQLLLAASGAIRDQLIPTDQVAAEMISLLLERYPSDMQTRYQLDADVTSAADQTEAVQYARLEQAARQRGCLLPGGAADLDRFAGLFLDDLRSGRIGRISFEQPIS